MQVNSNQLIALKYGLQDLSKEKMPFRASLIIAKNIKMIEAEESFFIDQERAFAKKFLVFDDKMGCFVQTENGGFKIKEGLEQECFEARKDLDNFTVEINLMKIPAEVLESIECTPQLLLALTDIIEE